MKNSSKISPELLHYLPRYELAASGDGRDGPSGREPKQDVDHPVTPGGVPVGYENWRNERLDALADYQSRQLRDACWTVGLIIGAGLLAAVIHILLKTFGG